MKVLVTGGSGFIGSHVVDKLRNKGVGVRVFDMVISDYRDDIEFYQGSLLNFEQMRMAVSGVDAIFHLGAMADVKDVFQEPHYSEAINVRGTVNVLEAARLNGSIKRVIYGSTTWVYSGVNELHVDENTPLHSPSHLYTATKLTGEYYCYSYNELYGLDITILRYGIPYGPRARDGAVVPTLVKKAINGEPLTIYGDGSQFRRFVYVEDLAVGNILALKSIAKNRTYNLDGIERITIKEIVEMVRNIIGNVKIEYAPARTGDFSGKEVSSKRAEDELGWIPKISFNEGLKKYIDWYIQRKRKREEDLEKLDNILKE